MSKFTCIVLCVVAASLTKVSHAVTEEEKAEFREVMAPIIAECSEEHGVSEADIQKAKEAGSADGIKSCFLGCVMTKTETLDAKGLFDAETALSKLKKFVKSDDEFAKFEEIGKACMSVNEKAVSDGEAGCERAKLILACFLEHKADTIYGQFDTSSTEKKWETMGKTASVVNRLLGVSALNLDVGRIDDSTLSEFISIQEDQLSRSKQLARDNNKMEI